MRNLIAVAAVGATVAALGLAVPAAAAPPRCAGEPWMDSHPPPDERAALLVARMTLDEKVREMHTISDSEHSREVPPNSRLCIPALLMNNGPAGVSSGGPVMRRATALPAPIGQAATFDPS